MGERSPYGPRGIFFEPPMVAEQDSRDGTYLSHTGSEQDSKHSRVVSEFVLAVLAFNLAIHRNTVQL